MSHQKKILIRWDVCCCHCFSLVEWILKQVACTSRINFIPSVVSPFVFVQHFAVVLAFNSVQLYLYSAFNNTRTVVTKQHCRNLDIDALFILIPYKQARGNRGEENSPWDDMRIICYCSCFIQGLIINYFYQIYGSSLGFRCFEEFQHSSFSLAWWYKEGLLI